MGIWLCFRKIICGTNANTDLIVIKGGNAGNGAAGVGGNAGGGGGGAGGGGGFAYIACNEISGSIANAINLSGGNGGNAGLHFGAGTGADGAPGASGTGGRYTLICFSDSTRNQYKDGEVDFPSVAGSGTTGGTASTCRYGLGV